MKRKNKPSITPRVLLEPEGRSAAVLPAIGIGDALLMMIASHQLQKQGYAVTTFHDSLPELSSWFPTHNLQKRPTKQEDLASYDLIIAENDNSSTIRELLSHHRHRLSIFYPSYLTTKHAPLSALDKVFDSTISMAENIAHAVAQLIDLPSPSKNNGLTPPSTLIHRSQKEQILIHPTSRVPAKNWKESGYLKLAKVLTDRGFKPLFCVGPQEKDTWSFVQDKGFPLASTSTLADLASLVYESGFAIGNDSLLGHLASNLNIPTLIIANDAKRMRLWRPDWLQGRLVLPPSYLPNWKFLRLRENHWQSFISKSRVLRSFDKLLNAYL